MPANSHRLDVRVTKETKRHLEKLRKEASEATGHFVSMNSLVSAILDDSRKKYPVESFDEEKKELFLLLISSS